MHFENPKEIVSQEGLIYNNLFLFVHICHTFGDTSVLFDPYFQQFNPPFMVDSSKISMICFYFWPGC